MKRIHVVDSHTGGEPTRVVVSGGPDLGAGSLVEQRLRFTQHHDHVRRAIICEPRGSEVLVGALLCQPADPECLTGVIFFNNVGAIWMCGHGTIGLAVTLGHIGKITAGRYSMDTAVGRVAFEYDGQNTAALDNVPSYRLRKDVTVEVDGLGPVTGDVAWGGNWFFLVNDHQERLEHNNVERLTSVTRRIKQALARNHVTGADGLEIDHIELFAPPRDSHNHSRNFVLCPGNAYDRSPCGTGLSAKLACLAADGKLAPGESWRQESIVGSIFTGSYQRSGDALIPRISGQAYITGETTILIDENDPFAWGLSS